MRKWLFQVLGLTLAASAFSQLLPASEVAVDVELRSVKDEGLWIPESGAQVWSLIRSDWPGDSALHVEARRRALVDALVHTWLLQVDGHQARPFKEILSTLESIRNGLGRPRCRWRIDASSNDDPLASRPWWTRKRLSLLIPYIREASELVRGRLEQLRALLSFPERIHTYRRAHLRAAQPFLADLQGLLVTNRPVNIPRPGDAIEVGLGSSAESDLRILLDVFSELGIPPDTNWISAEVAREPVSVAVIGRLSRGDQITDAWRWLVRLRDIDRISEPVAAGTLTALRVLQSYESDELDTRLLPLPDCDD